MMHIIIGPNIIIIIIDIII